MLPELTFPLERTFPSGVFPSGLFDFRERNLRRALSAGVIRPYFQPMVALPSAAIVGFEVLARWVGPPEASLAPDVFIPLAEQCGLLPELTERLLRAACAAAVSWPEHLTLAVNISPLQMLNAGLPAMLRRVVEPTGFPLSRLEVEITEQALPGRISQAAAVALGLKQLGICLVMDDYGVGASDMERLNALPFDKVKLDRSLIRALEEHPESRAGLEAAIMMAVERGLTVVAEGIETVGQAEVLRQMDCHLAQGWLFGRPLPGHDVASALAEVSWK